MGSSIDCMGRHPVTSTEEGKPEQRTRRARLGVDLGYYSEWLSDCIGCFPWGVIWARTWGSNGSILVAFGGKNITKLARALPRTESRWGGQKLVRMPHCRMGDDWRAGWREITNSWTRKALCDLSQPLSLPCHNPPHLLKSFSYLRDLWFYCHEHGFPVSHLSCCCEKIPNENNLREGYLGSKDAVHLWGRRGEGAFRKQEAGAVDSGAQLTLILYWALPVEYLGWIVSPLSV